MWRKLKTFVTVNEAETWVALSTCQLDFYFRGNKLKMLKTL